MYLYFLYVLRIGTQTWYGDDYPDEYLPYTPYDDAARNQGYTMQQDANNRARVLGYPSAATASDMAGAANATDASRLAGAVNAGRLAGLAGAAGAAGAAGLTGVANAAHAAGVANALGAAGASYAAGAANAAALGLHNRSIYPMGGAYRHLGTRDGYGYDGGASDYYESFNGQYFEPYNYGHRANRFGSGAHARNFADFEVGVLSGESTQESEELGQMYEDVTGQHNTGLDIGLRGGFGGLAGVAGAAGLEGGLGHGRGSHTIWTHPIGPNALASIVEINELGGPAGHSAFRQERVNNLAHDIANGCVGGMLGEAALRGNAGLTGAAGLGKITGNEPGFGSNLGAFAGIATASGLNGGITMSPEDLGYEGKESLGATSRVAAAGKLGQSLGIKAGINAGIGDSLSLETLAGLGQGMAVAHVLDDHTNAIKIEGIEGPAAKVAGYAGIPGSGGYGSYASLLGMGPSGSASWEASHALGARGGDVVAENAAFNDVKLIKRLNEDIQRKKEDVIEDTLKKKMLETDLEEELKK